MVFHRLLLLKTKEGNILVHVVDYPIRIVPPDGRAGALAQFRFPLTIRVQDDIFKTDVYCIVNREHHVVGINAPLPFPVPEGCFSHAFVFQFNILEEKIAYHPHAVSFYVIRQFSPPMYLFKSHVFKDAFGGIADGCIIAMIQSNRKWPHAPQTDVGNADVTNRGST